MLLVSPRRKSGDTPSPICSEVHLRIKVVKHQLVKVVEIPALIQDVFHPWLLIDLGDLVQQNLLKTGLRIVA